MSYILEALRRSQAERERGQVPGLGAAQSVAAAPAGTARHGAPALWLGLGLGGGALLMAAAWWWWRPMPPAAAVAAAPPLAPAVTPARGPVALPVVVTAPPAPAPAPAPAPSPAPASAPAPAALPPAAPARLPTLAELSPEQRRDLPPMALGGSIWSENAQSRFVIVNGQVVREGEPAAPGVTVERIAPKAVQMRFRELRFEIPL